MLTAASMAIITILIAPTVDPASELRPGLWRNVTTIDAALSKAAPGTWQVRTMVQGGRDAATAQVCLPARGPRWPMILPPAIASGRDDRGACRTRGSLSIEGSASIDRFDLVARRAGPIAGYRRAVALLHIEGRRVAATCSSRRS